MKYVHSVAFHIFLCNMKSGTSGHLKATWEQLCINDMCSLKYLCHRVLSWKDLFSLYAYETVPTERNKKVSFCRSSLFNDWFILFSREKSYVQNLKAEIVVELVCVRDAEKPKVLKMFCIYLVRGNKFVLQNTCLLKQYSFIQYFQWGFGVVGFSPQNVLTYGDVKH